MSGKVFSPLFPTMQEALAWHPKERAAVCTFTVYQTRLRRRWRARWVSLPSEPIYSRNAVILVREIPPEDFHFRMEGNEMAEAWVREPLPQTLGHTEGSGR